MDWHRLCIVAGAPVIRVRAAASAARRLLRRHPCGQALAEFALILPVLLLVVAVVLDLGRLFHAQVSITNAAREGAFQAIQTPTSFVPGSDCPAGAATNLVMCRVQREARGSFATVQASDVTLTCSPTCTAALGSTVTVTVKGQFQLITPILSPFFGSTQLTLSSSATAPIEVLPPYSPPTPVPTPTPTPTPAPTPTPDPSATPGPLPTPPPCIYPPNVLGLTPADAQSALAAQGLHGIGYGDLTKGTKGVVRVQNPDHTECVLVGSDVSYHWRPSP